MCKPYLKSFADYLYNADIVASNAQAQSLFLCMHGSSAQRLVDMLLHETMETGRSYLTGLSMIMLTIFVLIEPSEALNSRQSMFVLLSSEWNQIFMMMDAQIILIQED